MNPAWMDDYLRRGFRLVFYPSKLKGPREKNWQAKVYAATDYTEGDNVGVLLGHEIAPGRYLLDIDFDWPEGLPLARRIFPSTQFGFGRASRKTIAPISHAFYTTSEPVVSRSFEQIEATDTDGTKLKPFVEIRGTNVDGSLGHQTMLPPSIHPDGDAIEMRVSREIAHSDLVPRRALLYAIACIFYRYLGDHGLVHNTRLAVAGFLLGLGLTEEEVILVGEAIADATGNDATDVPVAVRTTVARMKSGQKVQGKTALINALGEIGKKVIARIRSWVGDVDFLYDAKGEKILANHQENIRRAMAKLNADLRLNVFDQKPYLTFNGYTGPLQDIIATSLRLTIEKEFRFLPQKDHYHDVLTDIAFHRQYHPVLDYLKTLTWDGIPRIDSWLITAARAANTEFVRTIGALVLVAAVRRVTEPGAKFDEMLVLESGTQGLFKSSALRALCPSEEWFSDDLPLNVDAKQIIERTLGKWIIEASDLSGMPQGKVEHLKAMLSRQVDGPVRMAYGRLPVEQRRQFIIIGTTNSYEYLSDVTGNRRFWPCRVEKFDVPWILAHRDQLWAEAYIREQSGVSIRLPEHLYEHAALQQERRRQSDPWEHILYASIDWSKAELRFTMGQLWDFVGVSSDRQNRNDANRLTQIMQLYGFRRMTVRDADGKVVKGWGRGAAQRNLPVVPEDGGVTPHPGAPKIEGEEYD